MNESEIGALLDAHDGLLTACLDESLVLMDFIAAYGNFPQSYGLDAAAPASGQLPLRLFSSRIAFHVRVAGILAGLRMDDPATGIPADFMPTVVRQRLRMLVAKYPDFKVDAGQAL